MTLREASCACGQLSAACAGEPAFVSLCNCTQCQRRTGSAFGVAAFYLAEAVALSGEAAAYTRGSDNGYAVSFRFCPRCGTSVYWYPERKPEVIAVALGCFADPAFPPPVQSVHEDHRAPWLRFSFDGTSRDGL